MYIKRSVTPLIGEYLKQFPCVVLLGPRQAGKTTLLSQLGASWQRYDLELRADFDQISADPDLFLRTNTKEMAIDETQLLPTLFPALRVVIDRDRSRMGRFVLTGSSSPALLKSVSESLAGRAAVTDITSTIDRHSHGGSIVIDTCRGKIADRTTVDGITAYTVIGEADF